MNKYLKGSINLVIKSVILFMGLSFTFNVLIFGFIFFPTLIIKTDNILISNSAWWTAFVPGMLPLFFILTVMAIAILILFKVVQFVNLFDVGKIVVMLQGKKEKGASDE